MIQNVNPACRNKTVYSKEAMIRKEKKICDLDIKICTLLMHTLRVCELWGHLQKMSIDATLYLTSESIPHERNSIAYSLRLLVFLTPIFPKRESRVVLFAGQVTPGRPLEIPIVNQPVGSIIYIGATLTLKDVGVDAGSTYILLPQALMDPSTQRRRNLQFRNMMLSENSESPVMIVYRIESSQTIGNIRDIAGSVEDKLTMLRNRVKTITAKYSAAVRNEIGKRNEYCGDDRSVMDGRPGYHMLYYNSFPSPLWDLPFSSAFNMHCVQVERMFPASFFLECVNVCKMIYSVESREIIDVLRDVVTPVLLPPSDVVTTQAQYDTYLGSLTANWKTLDTMKDRFAKVLLAVMMVPCCPCFCMVYHGDLNPYYNLSLDDHDPTSSAGPVENYNIRAYRDGSYDCEDGNWLVMFLIFMLRSGRIDTTGCTEEEIELLRLLRGFFGLYVPLSMVCFALSGSANGIAPPGPPDEAHVCAPGRCLAAVDVPATIREFEETFGGHMTTLLVSPDNARQIFQTINSSEIGVRGGFLYNPSVLSQRYAEKLPRTNFCESTAALIPAKSAGDIHQLLGNPSDIRFMHACSPSLLSRKPEFGSVFNVQLLVSHWFVTHSLQVSSPCLPHDSYFSYDKSRVTRFPALFPDHGDATAVFMPTTSATMTSEECSIIAECLYCSTPPMVDVILGSGASDIAGIPPVDAVGSYGTVPTSKYYAQVICFPYRGGISDSKFAELIAAIKRNIDIVHTTNVVPGIRFVDWKSFVLGAGTCVVFRVLISNE